MNNEDNLTVCPLVSARLSSRSREEIPVIISMKNSDNSKLNSMVFSMAGGIKKDLPLVGAMACSLSPEFIKKLRNHPDVDYISFDSKVFALVDVVNSTISTRLAHDQGYSGKGVTVAVIDTGVFTHPDLVKPKNRIVGFKDFVNGKTSPYDDNGHGTHVSGIIAANGLSSNGRFKGIAPNANILSIKALDETGGGNTSDIVSAMPLEK